ncbi:MAG: response regulator [Cyclobacteriaceae bacterium]
MDKIRTLIVDDEHLARQVITSYLSEDGDINIVGTCSDGFEGLKCINDLKPDLVFLDIMMPKLTGLEMLELIEDAPVIIFSTAYDQYAIKAFEQNAVDYLLKPTSKDRFYEALEKAKERVRNREDQKPKISGTLISSQEEKEIVDRIVVKNGAKINIIYTSQIRYLEAMDDYVYIHTGDAKYLKQQTMKYYEEHLLESEFVRIHRSYIVKVSEISRLEQMGKDTHVALLHDGTQLSISRSGYGKLKRVLAF